MISALLILFGLSAWSQAPSVQPSAACKDDIVKFCANIKPGLDVVQCLLENQKDVSNDCKQEMQRISEALKQTSSRSSGGLAAFGGGPAGSEGLFPPKETILTYGGSFAPKKEPTSVEQEKFSISTPVYNQGAHSFSMNASYGSLNLSDPPLLTGGDGDKVTPFPSNMQRVELGMQYSEMLSDAKFGGVKFSVGSASDKPFYSIKEMTFSLMGFYSFPSSREGRWFWTVFASNNNPIANYVPIPGFVYLYRTENFMGLFGLPFASLVWTPVDPWLLSISAFGPTGTAEIARGHRDEIQVYTGVNWTQQSFLRQGRTNDDYRLVLDEKKFYLGLRSPLPVKGLSTDLQIGQAFGRSVFEGTRFDRKEGGSATIGNSGYAAWNFNWTF